MIRPCSVHFLDGGVNAVSILNEANWCWCEPTCEYQDPYVRLGSLGGICLQMFMVYIVVKFQSPSFNTFWDMNFFLVTDRQTGGRTDGKRCIGAHRAYAQVGLKKAEKKISMFPVTFFSLPNFLFRYFILFIFIFDRPIAPKRVRKDPPSKKSTKRGLRLSPKNNFFGVKYLKKMASFPSWFWCGEWGGTGKFFNHLPLSILWMPLILKSQTAPLSKLWTCSPFFSCTLFPTFQ